MSINKNQVLLAVVVSCKACKTILKKNLSALKNQNLNPQLWIPIFLLKEEQRDSGCIALIKDYFPSPQILFLQKNQDLYKMRNLAFENINYPYIYFIDEDVILENSQHLSHLIELHKKFPEFTVIGATYLNHPDCTFWGRTYNWIVSLWIKNQKTFVPAGNLSVKTKKTFKARFYSPHPLGFGGEEIHFIKALQKEGHKSLYDKKLDTMHLAIHSLKSFMQRAWIHGCSLACEKEKKASSYFLFFKEQAPFLIKMSALFYLLLVRFSFFFYKIKMYLR